ncbi:MAG: hypothetical protein J0H40_17025 [Rhizobiales bacterium]|nr:hypothetical protein [Hyphomicrobiales bacterium]
MTTAATKTATGYADAVPSEIVLDHSPARYYEAALLMIDQEGDVMVTKRSYHGGDGAPPDECYGRTLVWSLASSMDGDCTVDVDALRNDLSAGGELAVLIDRVIAGHSVDWDGRNMVGRMTDDAHDALSAIASALDDNDRYTVA